MYFRARGFTLLETIVALLISSFAVAMVFQSLRIFVLARDRVAASGATLDRDQLALTWMRQSAEGLLSTNAVVFKGNRHDWSGVTTAAMLARPGVPQLVQWNLSVNGTPAAAYVQGSNSRLTLMMPAGGLEFLYMDEDGKTHRQWPPAMGAFPQLPSAIALEAIGRDRPLFVAPVIAAHNPLPNQGPFDAEGDQ
jgi:prepilin-type N-terminal cleavage/methylation domain-containing protein